MKRCPFCDYKMPLLVAVLIVPVDAISTGGERHQIPCPRCGACGPLATTARSAVEAWEMREGKP